MRNVKITLIFMVICSANSLQNEDENRPYEFGFTIDGQQHRHEKKDINGIIQGEFGFITADGVYHVTIYATDANGSFKILSMKNIKISEPLDGSGDKFPSTKPLNGIQPVQKQQVQNKVENRKPPVQPEPFAKPPLQNLNEQLQIVTTKKSYVFTTQPTIKPACAGCGYVTLPSVTTSRYPITYQPNTFANQNNVPIMESHLTNGNTFNSANGETTVGTGIVQNSRPMNDVTNFSNQQNLNDGNKNSQQNLNSQNVQNPLLVSSAIESNNENKPSTAVSSIPTRITGNADTFINQNQDSITNYNPSNPYQPITSNVPIPPSQQNLAIQTSSFSTKPNQISSMLTSHPYSEGGQTYGIQNPISPNSGQTFGVGGEIFGTQNADNSFNYRPNYSTLPNSSGDQIGIGGQTSSMENVNNSSNYPNYSTLPNKETHLQTVTHTRPSTLNSASVGVNNFGSQNPNEPFPSNYPLLNRPHESQNAQQNLFEEYAPVKQSSFSIPKPNLINASSPTHSVFDDIEVTNDYIKVPNNPPIKITDKYPGMKDGLPNDISEGDITDLLYKFNYTIGFHGHYEKGWRNGTKIGGYFVNGRDGISRVVTYIADELGYRPKFKLINLGLDSPDTPKEETEKKFGLKSFEFVWYPLK